MTPKPLKTKFRRHLLIEFCKSYEEAEWNIGRNCIANMSLTRPLNLNDIEYSAHEGFRWGYEWANKKHKERVEWLKERMQKDSKNIRKHLWYGHSDGRCDEMKCDGECDVFIDKQIEEYLLNINKAFEDVVE